MYINELRCATRRLAMCTCAPTSHTFLRREERQSNYYRFLRDRVRPNRSLTV